MNRGERSIPLEPREELLERSIMIITILPSQENSVVVEAIAVFVGEETARLIQASRETKGLVSLVEGIYQRSRRQEGVDFWAELEPSIKRLNGIDCQISNEDPEEESPTGKDAANKLWEALKEGNELKVDGNCILVVGPKGD